MTKEQKFCYSYSFLKGKLTEENLKTINSTNGDISPETLFYFTEEECIVYGLREGVEIQIYRDSPILDVSLNLGLYRDRNPDANWGEVRSVNLDLIKKKKVFLSKEIKLILLQDLAFVYGKTSSKFEEKLKEFKLI